MSEAVDALYKMADQFRTGTCTARLGERWCEGELDHESFYHVTDNGVAWMTGPTGTIYDVHPIDESLRQ